MQTFRRAKRAPRVLPWSYIIASDTLKGKYYLYAWKGSLETARDFTSKVPDVKLLENFC